MCSVVVLCGTSGILQLSPLVPYGNESGLSPTVRLPIYTQPLWLACIALVLHSYVPFCSLARISQRPFFLLHFRNDIAMASTSGNPSSFTLPSSVRVSLSSIAQMLDHALLHPTMTDSQIADGLSLCASYRVATACVKPYSVPSAVRALHGSSVPVCAVIGFPAGNSSIAVKAFEAGEAVREGAKEVDMVVNVGKALSGDWAYVEREVQAVNDAVTQSGGSLKVIFETDYLQDEHIVRLCEICSKVGVAFVKTSTGFGFVQQPSGQYAYTGATLSHVALMKANVSEKTRIKASGGVRTLDDLLRYRALGVRRIGTSSTKAIMEEAKRRGIVEDHEIEVQVPPLLNVGTQAANGSAGPGY